MQFEDGNVVVQRLGIVVVVDVGGGHSEGLGSRAAILLCEVVVANPDIYGVSCSNNTENRSFVMMATSLYTIPITKTPTW